MESGIQTEARRRRVQRLKKYIILLLLLSSLVPIVMCVVLFVQAAGLNRSVRALTEQLGILQQQQTEMAEKFQNWEAGREETGDGKISGGDGLQNSGNSGGQGTADAGNQGQEEPVAAHEVYLTFDDGPSIYTEEILDILDDYQVKATFFVVGKESDAAKEALRDIVARGHTLGMHSYSHKYSELYASEEAFEADFLKLQGYLEDVTGVKSKVYRFPGGSSNTVSKVNMGIYADYLDSQEVRFFDWNISSGDGGSAVLPVETLVENVTGGISENQISVVLMHDSAEKSTTVEALPTIIENILAMEDTVILPITENTRPVQHIHRQSQEAGADERTNGGIG